MSEVTERTATEQSLARRLAECGRLLHRDGLIGGLAGNLSARLGEDTIVITPRGTNKGHLEPAQMVALSLAAKADEAAAASTEFPFHRACYRARPDVGGVVHTHAPALIAAGLRDLDVCAALPELSLATGAIVTVPLLDSGSEELGAAVGRAVAGGAGVVLLRGHGAVAVGPQVEDAMHRMELAELAAYAVLLAEDGHEAVDGPRLDAILKKVMASD